MTVDSDPTGFRLSIDPTDLATGNNQYDLYLKTGQQIVAKIVVKLHALTGRHISNQLSGLSGLGEQYGKVYSVCTMAPGTGYAIVEKSATSSLTGDRTSCNVWSTCQQTVADNKACLAFSMQGHSENRPDRPHQSIGLIEADYVAIPSAPKLSAITPAANGAPQH